MAVLDKRNVAIVFSPRRRLSGVSPGRLGCPPGE